MDECNQPHHHGERNDIAKKMSPVPVEQGTEYDAPQPDQRPGQDAKVIQPHARQDIDRVDQHQDPDETQDLRELVGLRAIQNGRSVLRFSNDGIHHGDLFAQVRNAVLSLVDLHC